MARDDVRHMVAISHPYPLYAWLLVLASLPALVAALRFRTQRSAQRPLRVICAGCVLSSALSGVLFLYALDWGRWIYIHIFSVFLLLVFVDGMVDSEPGQTVSYGFGSGWRRALCVVLLAIYATTWTLPRIPSVLLKNGYFGLWVNHGPGEASR